MREKNILVMGEYYPQKTIRSQYTSELSMKLKEMGNNLFLLSPSWCVENKENLSLEYEKLTQKGPFDDRFFVDPFQLKEGFCDVFSGLQGLLYKILEIKKINCVFFLLPIKYLPLINSLDEYCEIETYYAETDGRIDEMTDDYLLPIVNRCLKKFDKIVLNKNISEHLCSTGIDQSKIIDTIESLSKINF